jgi:TIR domain-containing protein
MSDQLSIKVVDAFDLDDELRSLLKPGEMMRDEQGRRHKLPRYFYEIPDHEVAASIRLTPHFGFSEFLLVDLKEAPRLREYPRYVPCAVRTLAFFLEQFRTAVGAPVHLSVNGGYRSPSHKLSSLGSPHMWGTAADIYRIGSIMLATRDAIEKFNAVAENMSDELNVSRFGHTTGTVADHLHFDLGYVTHIPREISEDRMEVPMENRPRFAFEERRRREIASLVRPAVIEKPQPLSRNTQGAIQYDVFISHATDDKEDVVRPLANALVAMGLHVWYDEFSLKWGDSLRKKIDAGLANSRFGLVVLSHAFFAKDWPQYELDGLVTREMTGQQLILPLWHRITKNEILERSPSLVDKVARNTTDYSIEELATEIAEVIRSTNTARQDQL